MIDLWAIFFYSYASIYKYNQYCHDDDNVSKDKSACKALDFSDKAEKWRDNETENEYHILVCIKEISYIYYYYVDTWNNMPHKCKNNSKIDQIFRIFTQS